LDEIELLKNHQPKEELPYCSD